jgi:hypothetical protein
MISAIRVADQEAVVQELGGQAGDLVSNGKFVGVELGDESFDDRRRFEPRGSELPVTRPGDVEAVDLIGAEVNEHDLLVNAASDDLC